MKKIIIVLTLILLLTTGCSKKLICTKEDKNDMVQTKETFIVNYKSDTMNSIQITLNTTIKKGYETYVETVEKNLKEQFQKYEKIKGITVSSNSRDDQVIVEIFIELNKMSEKDKKKLNFINLEENYDQLQKTLEKSKYQCSK